MLAYRTLADIGTNVLHLQIPDSFKGKHVEVLVLEIEDNKSEGDKNTGDFQNLLLSAPTWSDDEYAAVVDARSSFSSWKLE